MRGGSVECASVEGNIMSDVRGEPADIDGVWMTEALQAAGVARGAQVVDVAVEALIGTGQTGRNARLRLTWDDPTGRPSSVVGKFPSADSNARTAAFQTAATAPSGRSTANWRTRSSIRTPTCHVARYDHDAAGLRVDHGGPGRLHAGRPVRRPQPSIRPRWPSSRPSVCTHPGGATPPWPTSRRTGRRVSRRR